MSQVSGFSIRNGLWTSPRDFLKKLFSTSEGESDDNILERVQNKISENMNT